MNRRIQQCLELIAKATLFDDRMMQGTRVALEQIAELLEEELRDKENFHKDLLTALHGGEPDDVFKENQ